MEICHIFLIRNAREILSQILIWKNRQEGILKSARIPYPLGTRIQSVITTFDRKHAFAGLVDGSLRQICIDSQKVIKNYGKVHETCIISIAVSRDNSFLITSGEDQRVLKISITHQKVVKDFGRICKQEIKFIQLAPGDESLFVYDNGCHLKLIELTDGTTVHDFGRVHYSITDGFQQSLVTRDGEYLFTSCYHGFLQQWSVRGRALVQDFGELSYNIWSVCV
jgi:hypothetical protein